MNYVAYYPNGRIFQSGSCQAECLDAQGPSDTTKMEVANLVDPNTHYVSAGAVVQMPAKPSSNHKFNYSTKQWEDPRTLDDLKAEKWRNIKFNRDEHEYGGFTWDGSVFDSDALSQQRIAGAVQLAQMNPAFTTVWTLATNDVRSLNARDMMLVGLALGEHVTTVFSRSQLLRNQINQATTQEEVEGISW